jgi:hypothetical protein
MRAFCFVNSSPGTETQRHLEFVQCFSPAPDPDTHSLSYDVYRALVTLAGTSELVRFGLRMFPGNSGLQRLGAECEPS